MNIICESEISLSYNGFLECVEQITERWFSSYTILQVLPLKHPWSLSIKVEKDSSLCAPYNGRGWEIHH